MNASAARASRMPTYYLSHGGGPWPYMTGAFRSNFDVMAAALSAVPSQLPCLPVALLVISGHWEAGAFTLSSAERPGMVYDFEGFPEYTYHALYPAPGAPQLAGQIQAMLNAAGWDAELDDRRGFDHGTFSVAAPMYPAAEVPVVQLALKRSLDAGEHFAIGRALAPLRDAGVLIIGSGESYHNLALWGRLGAAPSAAFDAWLRQTLLTRRGDARAGALLDWERAPAARTAHPRADHLMPLMVAAGAAYDDPATCIYSELFTGHISHASYRFGADLTPTGYDLLGR
ncbi:aromatic ring-opening dioxygenase catalytic subunit (LigB family) [Duganella sp. SG902]|uniref:DODA-type extradiol aromatic ring-opening family dioxygenase n=1 Tax=Duganella sp. SG902 TaxID=2587016 RepID=UPI00159DBEF2|nr:class III extradiol ring-cleavage dioxygenase [Duganella sp. SG902]NVM77518.1 aromatic ring-opening dioxygenase catalytic subunit (LigB family) [Duganella sp. SG902]